MKVLIQTLGTTKSTLQIKRVAKAADRAADAMERLVDSIAELKDILIDNSDDGENKNVQDRR